MFEPVRKLPSRKISAFALLLAIASAPSGAAAPPTSPPAWQGRSVMTAGNVSDALAISVDGSGRTVTAWADTEATLHTPPGPAAIRLLRGDGFGWRELVVGTLGAVSVGRVDIDAGGATWVAYHDRGSPLPAIGAASAKGEADDPADDRVRIVRVPGAFASAIPEPLIDAPASSEFDLALAFNGLTLWLAFRDAVSGELRLQQRDGNGTWSLQTVPSVGTDIRGIAFREGIDVNRHIAYSSELNGTRGLRLATFDGQAWSTTTLRADGVSAGQLRISRTGGPTERLAILVPIDDPSDQRIELYTSSFATWTSRRLEGYGPGTISAQAVELGIDGETHEWRALWRRADAANAAVPYRYARVDALVAAAPPQLSDFGITPRAEVIPGADQGALAASLDRGMPRAVLQRRLHSDLDYFTWQPDWQDRVLISNEFGLDPVAGAALARDLDGRPIIVAAFADSVIRLGWNETGQFARSSVVSGLGSVRDLDIAVGPDGVEHVVFQRRQTADLIYATRQPGAELWNTVTLDSIGDVGSEAQVHVARDGTLFITHANRDTQRAAVLIAAPGQGFVRLSDPSGPTMGNQLRAVRSTLQEMQLTSGETLMRLLVAFVPNEVDAFSRGVRVYEVDFSSNQVQRAVGRDVGIPVHVSGGTQFRTLGSAIDIASLDDGRVALAVAQSSSDSSQHANRVLVYDARTDPLAGPTNAQVDAGFGATGGTFEARELRIGLKNGGMHGTRLVTRVATAINAQQLDHHMGTFPLVDGNFGDLNFEVGRIDFDARYEDMIVWFDEVAGSDLLVFGWSTSPRHGFGPDPMAAWIASRIPLEPRYTMCQCAEALLRVCIGLNVFCIREHPCPIPSGTLRAAAGTPATQLGDELRRLFNGSAAGRYYLQLWNEHASEIFALTRADPGLMRDRLSTYSSFVPGLTALVDGRGGEVSMTPAMLAQARGVWDGWASAGSPRLRADIQSELARLDDLAAFDDMRFDQWFAALTVGSAGSHLFSDGFEDDGAARVDPP